MSLSRNQSGFFIPTLQEMILKRLSITELKEFFAVNPHLDLTPFAAALKIKTDVLLTPLLQAVAYGQQDEVQRLLAANPFLLFETGTVVDYSGRTIAGSPYQIALGAEDTDMLAMMQQFIATDEEHALAAKQYAEQFPHGVANPPSDYDYSALVAAIAADHQLKIYGVASAATEVLLEKFRQGFAPTGVIKTGKHFNLQHLLKSFDVYGQTYDSWNHYQLSLFWRQVIGYLQRLVPACYAQAFSHGIYRVAERKEKLARSFKLDGGVSYFPVDLHAKTGLGFEFGVYSDETVRRMWAVHEMGLRVLQSSLQNLWLAKTADMQRAYAAKDRIDQQYSIDLPRCPGV